MYNINMSTCLIGYTGFVGTNLIKSTNFDVLINSKNFKSIKYQHFDTIICAGISAVKYLANANPEEDWNKINELIEVLKTVTADKVIVISTVDIYNTPIEVTEHSDYSKCVSTSAYGLNRYKFEQFCNEHFPNTTVIRLPGLFGEGLKKNVIFDLLNNNMIGAINPDASFQYYNLSNLWNDIKIALTNNIKCLNISTEPIVTSDIANKFFQDCELTKKDGVAPRYDMHSVYANVWNKTGNYLYSKDDIMHDLEQFIKEYKHA